MPLIMRCKECGYILYEGSWLEARSIMFTPIRKVITKHDGKCPKCGRELKMPSAKDITISPNLEYFPRRGKKDES